MSEIKSIDELVDLVRSGVTDFSKFGDVRTVERGALLLFNYTNKCQFENRWNYFERISRGLIISKRTGEVIARPFDKFWNWGEREHDGAPVEITEKLDGSMISLWVLNGEFFCSTRGSFDSEQAKWADRWLHEKYTLKELFSIPNELTLIFEAIYPENRVVVDYRGVSDLVLIGARNRFTGEDHFLSSDAVSDIAKKFNFTLPKFYTQYNIEAVLFHAGSADANTEGWVARFADGQRYKIKGDAYRIAHKLMTGMSFNRILEAVMNGNYDSIVDSAPDEFLTTVREYKAEIDQTVDRIILRVSQMFSDAPSTTRKEFALWVQANCPNDQAYMFAMLDNRELAPLIYRNAFKDRISSESLTDVP